MKILIFVNDLYKKIGGGETVYRNIVESSAKIDFFYFIDNEKINSNRPKNTHAIKLKKKRDFKLKNNSSINFLDHGYLSIADAYVRSVANMSFDIIEVPDYQIILPYLKTLLLKYQVKYNKLVLSLHGNISKSIKYNWGNKEISRTDLEYLEKKSFIEADFVYGISSRYINEWKTKYNRNVSYIDPINFINIPKVNYKKTNSKISINLIGRLEKIKGPHLFVEIMKWIPATKIKEINIIGDDYIVSNDNTAKAILSNMSLSRDLNINFLDSKNHNELQKIYAKNSIVCLPVVYDTLNLVALEAIFSGCPVAVSESCGVCDYLDTKYPNLPYIKLTHNKNNDIKKIEYLLNNYDKFSVNLINELKKIKYEKRFNYETLYNEALKSSTNKTLIHSYEFSPCIAKNLIKLFFQNIPFLLPAQIKSLLKLKLRIKKFISGIVKSFIKTILNFNHGIVNCKNSSAINNSLRDIYKRFSVINIIEKYKIISFLEECKNNYLFVVTYNLRIFRLSGIDNHTRLTDTVNYLNELNFKDEAECLKLMYELNIDNENDIYLFLKNNYKKNLFYKQKEWDFIQDNRNKLHYKISIVVSLYNAVDKLELFLDLIFNQSLILRNHVEIILVDSGSPSDEFDLFKKYIKKNNIKNIVFARSKERETIQSAWNRGIGLSRGEYLVFLGVDETLYPDALELLSYELDKDKNVDWVMSNSLVTSSDEKGNFINDLMIYNRKNGHKNLTFLETCYTSWVGGMYRKNIHDRFGYYDETFSGAGDTEFKNRILSKINVKYINKTLGLFINYPDGQTTASPKVEIEDLKAWYFYRTAGGIKYLFENQSKKAIEDLIFKCLGYRKSYCNHISTDIEFAYLLVKYYVKRFPKNQKNTKLLILASDLQKMLHNFKIICNKQKFLIDYIKVPYIKFIFKAYSKKHQNLFNLGFRPQYLIFNDNRFEQHNWYWKSV